MARRNSRKFDVIDRYNDGNLVKSMRDQLGLGFIAWLDGQFKNERGIKGNGAFTYARRCEDIVRIVNGYFGRNPQRLQDLVEDIGMSMKALHVLASSEVWEYPSVIVAVRDGAILPTEDAMKEAIQKCKEQKRLEGELQAKQAAFVTSKPLIHIVDDVHVNHKRYMEDKIAEMLDQLETVHKSSEDAIVTIKAWMYGEPNSA